MSLDRLGRSIDQIATFVAHYESARRFRQVQPISAGVADRVSSMAKIAVTDHDGEGAAARRREGNLGRQISAARSVQVAAGAIQTDLGLEIAVIGYLADAHDDAVAGTGR